VDDKSIKDWLWEHRSFGERVSVFLNRFAVDVHPSARQNFREDILSNPDILYATDDSGKKVSRNGS
jgi:hypothetical protein